MAGVRQDNVQVKLEINGSQAKTELDNLTRRSQILEEELKGLKKGTQEYINSNKELKEVKTQMEAVRGELGLSGMTLRQLDKEAKELKRALADLPEGTDEFVKKSQRLQEVKTRATEVRNAIDGIDDELKKGGNSFLDFAKKGAAIVGIGLGIDALFQATVGVGKEIFNTTAQFETFEAVLTNALGSESAAQKAMADIQEMAKKTPFSVEELTASFLKFVNRGLNPTMAEMSTLADIAASQGKSFDQLTEAVLDAGTGEFERLKEFGIKASKSGDQVSLSFKGVNQTVKNTPEAINGAIQAFGKMNGVAGSTAAISNTLTGQLSNLFDSLGQRAVKWGESLMPVFKGVLGFLSGMAAGSDSATDSFKKQATTVETLEKKTVPLITRYEELKGKSSRNKEEQKEMEAALQELAKTIPTAVTEFDKYGKALGLNTDKAREFVAQQKAILEFKNQDAIKETKEQLADYTRQIQQTTAALNQLDEEGNHVKDVTVRVKRGGEFEFDSKQVKLTDAELNELNATLARLNTLALGATGTLAELKGDPTGIKEETAAVKELVKSEEELSKERIEALKQRQAAIQLGLLQVKEGSAEEVRLKKQLVLVARDIDLEGEKLTAADKALIRAKAFQELRKLDEDFNKKSAEEAKKRRETELAADERIQQLHTSLIKDEFARRSQELKDQAAKESAAVKGSDEQIAAQRVLIAEKLAVDLEKVAEERVKKDAEISRKAIQADAELALLRAKRTDDPGAIEKALQAKLLVERDLALENKELTEAEKLVIQEEYEVASAELHKKYADEKYQQEVKTYTEALQQMQQGLQVIADFKQLQSNKEISREEKAKQQRLKSLENEYKQGKISKDAYEKAKEGIESESDVRIRNAKRKAAEDDKKLAIAESLIAGTLAVIKAGPNPAAMIATGIVAALSTAKIIATPLPTFGKGGVWGSVKRMFGNGGISPVAGVPSVGQRHGDGGIQMIDGKTGQHLGEWETGEPYMILSRNTYANNKEVIDQLLDTSLYRNGASIKAERGGIYAADGAVTGATPAGSAAAGAGGNSDQLIAAINRTTAAVQQIPSRIYAVVDPGEVEEVLEERAAVRNEAAA